MDIINQSLEQLGFRSVTPQEIQRTKQAGYLPEVTGVLQAASAQADQTARQRVLGWLRWLASSSRTPPSSPGRRPSSSAVVSSTPPAHRDERSPAACAAGAPTTRGEHDNRVPATFNNAGPLMMVDTTTGELVPGRQGLQQVKVYAGKGAMQFELTEPQNTRRGPMTIRIEAARGSDKVYAWNAKIAIQCSLEELIQLAAVLHGITTSARFANHGPTHDKTFSIEAQGNQFYARMNTGEQGSLIGVPIPPQWAASIALLVMAALRACYPGATSTDLLVTIRATLGRLSDAVGPGNGRR